MVQKSQTTTWDGAKTFVNNGINYQPQLVLAGFQGPINSKNWLFHQTWFQPSPGLICMVNVGKYTIHGSYGWWYQGGFVGPLMEKGLTLLGVIFCEIFHRNFSAKKTSTPLIWRSNTLPETNSSPLHNPAFWMVSTRKFRDFLWLC